MVNSTGIVAGPKRDLVGYEGNPPKVAWPGGAKIAISLVVNYEEGSELAIGDGDATREPSGPAGWPITKRDLAGEGAFEYGSRAGYWRLLDVFDEQDVKCTFYACAVALERNRDAAKEMRGRGHDVMSHGYRWEDVSLLTREQEREHIRLAVASIAETVGERPLGWYCRYGPSVHTRELVVEEGGFLFDCDAYNDDLPYWTMVGDKKHLGDPVLARDQRREIQLGRFRLPGGFREVPQGEFRSALQGGPDPSQDDVDRPAYAPDRPSRPRASAGKLHRLRQVPPRCLVRPPHRHRAPLDGASRLIF